MAKAANSLRNLKAEGKKIAKEAAFNPVMERLTRLGYAVKGFLYAAIGIISIAGALGKSNTPADQLGAIVAFSKLPYVEPMLWIILLGLVSYSLWGLIRVFLDPFHKGIDMEGLLSRAGYLISAVTYASFVVPTYQLIIGGRKGTGGDAMVKLVTQIMNMPLGRYLVGALGLVAIGAGLYQMYIAIKMDFDQRFKPYALTADQRKIAVQVGRFGTFARGVVFAIVGFFLAVAAVQANAGRARGFDGALDYLAEQPYGIWLLGIIAMGLIAFGFYSLMSAAWFRFKH